MKVIYIAGPFRSINEATGKSDAWGVQQNVMKAMTLALEVWKLGHAALCPHSNAMFFQDAHGCEDRVWLEGDLELLRRCDGVLLIDNWARSSGARAEKAYAKSIGLPVFMELRDLKDWLRDQAALADGLQSKVAGV